MVRKQTHTHNCEFEKNGCRNVLECDGEYQRNHDGFPEAVCEFYHLAEAGDRACEACSESMCSECGSILRLEAHDEGCAVLVASRQNLTDAVQQEAKERAAMKATEAEIVQAMETHGGSFVKSLARSFGLADDQNRERLRKAFHDYWEEYGELAGMLKLRRPMPLHGEELRPPLAKPAKGSRWMELREKRKAITKGENTAKAEVRQRDGRCRWPHCENCRLYKPPFEVAHVVRAKGMGGDHGTVSTADRMMLLDRLTHSQEESNQREVRPLTDAGTDGPCEFWRWTHSDGWFLIAREIAPFTYERD